jgi:hypothetical protein
MGLVWLSVRTAIIYLNSINQLISATVKFDVLFEVQTESLNIIKTRVGFKKTYARGFFFSISCLPDCWLVVSMHPEGPATGHLDTGFLGFPLSSSKC